jgi:hypothetical protein
MRSRNCLPLTRNRVHLTFGEHLCSPYPWRARVFTLPLTSTRVHLTFAEHLCSPYSWRAPVFTLPLASTWVHLTLGEHQGSHQDFGRVRVAHLFSFLYCALFVCLLFICHGPVSCMSNVASVSGFVMGLCLVCPMLPVSLDLSWACVLCVQCCQCLWICHGPVSCVFNVASVTGFVMGLCLVCPMLPVSLDYLFLRISV